MAERLRGWPRDPGIECRETRRVTDSLVVLVVNVPQWTGRPTFPISLLARSFARWMRSRLADAPTTPPAAIGPVLHCRRPAAAGVQVDKWHITPPAAHAANRAESSRVTRCSDAERCHVLRL